MAASGPAYRIDQTMTDKLVYQAVVDYLSSKGATLEHITGCFPRHWQARLTRHHPDVCYRSADGRSMLTRLNVSFVNSRAVIEFRRQ